MKIFLLIALSLFPSFAYAEDSLGGVGIGITAFLFTPTDPAGRTDSELSFTPLSLYYTTDLGRDSRVMSNFTYTTYEVEAPENFIAQNVTRISITTMYQTKMRVSRSFKPWFGVGFTFATEEFENRFTLDKDGFLDKSYSNREDSGIAVELDFTDSLYLFNTNFVFRASYTKAFYDGSSGIQASFIWFY